MRTLRLCGLTLLVAAAHLIGWKAANLEPSRFALPRAGVRWMELAPATSLAQVPPSAPARASTSVATSADGGPTVSTRSVPTSPGAPATTAWRSPSMHELAPAPPPVRPSSRKALARARARETPVAHPPPAGDDGAVRATTAPAPVWPIYPTRAPPSTMLRYILVQGTGPAASAAADTPGEAELEWTRDATTFSLRIATSAPGRAAREWRSAGTFDAAGIAPGRLVERERGRDKRAINFDRDSQRVRFSGASQALPLAPGAQDRWSWIAQLAAIAEAARHADGTPVPLDTVWEIQVAGLRGELDRWRFRVLPDTELPRQTRLPRNEGSDPAVQAPALLHVMRDPERPYDLRIEAWLSPSLHHLPIGLRMSTPPGSWSLAFWPPPAKGATPPPEAPAREARPPASAAGGS